MLAYRFKNREVKSVAKQNKVWYITPCNCVNALKNNECKGEIIMKTLKKALVTGLVAVMMVVNLAGCGKFDAAAYVESCLDLLTKGETEQYMKMTGRSKEQAESDYESNIDAMMTEMDQFNLSDELSNSYRQLFKDVYAKAKYTVKDAEKMDDKDGYYVTVEIEQMTGLFNGIQEELMTEFTEWANSFDADTYPTEDEMYEQMYQMMYDLMSARLDSITYNDPQEVVVEVIGEDNVYSISDGSMSELDEALLDVATE